MHVYVPYNIEKLFSDMVWLDYLPLYDDIIVFFPLKYVSKISQVPRFHL